MVQTFKDGQFLGAAPLTDLQNQILANGSVIAANSATLTTHAGQIATLQSQVISGGTTTQTPPTGVVISNLGTASATVTWVAPTSGGAPLYEVDYRVSGTQAWTPAGKTSALSFDLAGLSPAARYDVQVLANGVASATTSFTTPGIAPSAPTNVAASAITGTTMTVGWTASATGTPAPTYIVAYQSVTGGVYGTMKQVQGITGTSITLTGLTAGTQYSIVVQATNTAGTHAAAAITATTAAAATVAPSAPTGLTVTADATTPTSALDVAWTAPGTGTAPLSYTVSWRVSGTSAWSPATVTGTSYTITGLSSGTQYDVEVTAANSAGSATTGIVTGSTSAPAAPSNNSVSGSQNTGASDPVIGGPTAFLVTAGQSVALTGITLSDAAGPVDGGTLAFNLSCTVGTVSATVGGAPVAGSGTGSIATGLSWTAMQDAIAHITYTAPASGASAATVSFQVYDQTGASNTLSITGTINPASSGGGGGTVTVPTDTTGYVASPAAAFLNGIGLNTHIDFGAWGYQNLTTVENCINYIWGGSGIRPLIRDCPQQSGDTTWFPQVSQACASKVGQIGGARFISFIGETDPGSYSYAEGNGKSMAGPSGVVVFLEGCNEEDTYASNNGLDQQTELNAAAAYQQTVHADAQAKGVPCINMSFGQGWSASNNYHGNYDKVGDLSAYCDYGNAHVYPWGYQSPYGSLQSLYGDAKLAASSRPVAATEFGYTLNTDGRPGSPGPAISQTAQAIYLLMGVFGAWNLGYVLTVIYAMFDDGAGDWGIFDATGTPRAAAKAFANLFALLADTNASALSFSAGTLNISFSGGPAGLKCVVLQKANGEFWTALWNETPVTTSSGADQSVAAQNTTVTLGTQATTLNLYDPLTGTSSIQSAGGTTTITVPVTPAPRLLQIIR